MTPPDIPGLKARLLAEQKGFVADSVAQALEDAEADNIALSFQENGMSERTCYGQRVEDDAADQADEIFTRILNGYLQAVASFTAGSLYETALDHAVNVYEGATTSAEQDALERLIAAHDSFTQSADPTQKRDHARFLLSAPLEFADSNTQDLLSRDEQKTFSQILSKLRHLAVG